MYSNNTFFHCKLPSPNINSTKRSRASFWIIRVEISNLCNNHVAKQSKAGPPRAETSGGESTMLSANFAKAIRGKQALKNCFLFVRGPKFWDLRFHFAKYSFHFTKYRFSFCKVQIFISQSTDFHFAKYRFSFRKVQISFRKVQIFISQSTDFHFT